MIKIVSIELTNKCAKQCFFCYNESKKTGDTLWKVTELVKLVKDLSNNGVEAVSFGGGEPLEYEPVFELLEKTKGLLFRSITTNGLKLNETNNFEQLINAKPEKVHISVHFPENKTEVRRVKNQVKELSEEGIISGVNLLIRNDNIPFARAASDYLKTEGIDKNRIVYLPMRMKTPVSSEAVKYVANDSQFQSISCLNACGISKRFCSISWDKRIAWCSYTSSKKQLTKLNYIELENSLNNLNLEYCG